MLRSMFSHLLYIHLFRPFLKYNPSTSPLPSHVSPRKLCTQAAGSISKLMRLYKRTYGLRQICNIAVYMVHSACTIHLLNLPEKTAKRDIIHGVKHLEEIAEDWLCARRTLSILSVLARKWKIDLPDEAATVLTRTDSKFGFFSTADVPSPKHELVVATPPSNHTSPPRAMHSMPQQQNQARPHTQLQQSLYSYLPDGRSNGATSLPIPTPNNQTNMSQSRDSFATGIGSMNMPNEPIVPTVPYPRHNYSNSASSMTRSAMTPGNDLPRSNSGVTSEASGSLTRQVSPTMFGGVEALVESQDWWLRDQASLAIGFDNWMSAGSDLTAGAGTGQPGLNGSASAEIDQMTGSGYYMPPNVNGKRNDGFDDEWY